MRWELLFPSKFFKAADFMGTGPVTLTIEAVLIEEIKGKNGNEKKAVMYFRENTEKSLILNKTNAAACAAMHGNEIEGWAGKQVTLGASKDRMGGKVVDCVRILESKGAK